MSRTFALVLAFLVGVLAHPVRAAVPATDDGVMLAGVPAEYAMHGPRRESLAKGERAAVGGVERGTWDGDDIASLPTRHPPVLSVVSAAIVWRVAAGHTASRHMPRPHSRGPPAVVR